LLPFIVVVVSLLLKAAAELVVVVVNRISATVASASLEFCNNSLVWSTHCPYCPFCRVPSWPCHRHLFWGHHTNRVFVARCGRRCRCRCRWLLLLLLLLCRVYFLWLFRRRCLVIIIIVVIFLRQEFLGRFPIHTGQGRPRQYIALFVTRCLAASIFLGGHQRNRVFVVKCRCRRRLLLLHCRHFFFLFRPLVIIIIIIVVILQQEIFCESFIVFVLVHGGQGC
jgi:hypothetical protein